MAPIVSDIIFITLEAFFNVCFILPMAFPWLYITLTSQQLPTYLFEEPWQTFEILNLN